MKYIISRYNHDMTWLNDYPDAEIICYDRSDNAEPIDWGEKLKTIVVPNIGTDLYDKFTYIIDNYDNLPDIAVYTKANLFKYITKEEFDALDKTKFQPLLTKNHKTYADAEGTPVCYYDNKGMFNEINNFWYLYPHPAKFAPIIIDHFNMKDRLYNEFAPGSNYILPKENILKHPKELYEKLRSCLDWDIYPGDAQLLERNLFYLWQ